MTRFVTSLIAVLFLGASAIAAGSGGGGGGAGGGGGGGGGSGSSGATGSNTCYNGKVWDNNKKMCVDESAHLDDGSLIEHAYQLASLGKPHEALTFLARVVDREDPHFLNIKGFATRKAGDVDAGIVFYKQALALDSDNVLVREYLGEAFASKGDFVRARAELEEIVRICGNTACAEYLDLADAIIEAGGSI